MNVQLRAPRGRQPMDCGTRQPPRYRSAASAFIASTRVFALAHTDGCELRKSRSSSLRAIVGKWPPKMIGAFESLSSSSRAAHWGRIPASWRRCPRRQSASPDLSPCERSPTVKGGVQNLNRNTFSLTLLPGIPYRGTRNLYRSCPCPRASRSCGEH